MNHNTVQFLLFCLFVLNVSLILLYVIDGRRRDLRILNSVKRIFSTMNEMSERMDSAINTLQKDLAEIEKAEQLPILPVPKEETKPAKKPNRKKAV